MGEDRSWIKAYRSMMDKPAIWDSDCMTRLWLHCCFTANWKDTEWTIPATYQKIVVPRGSFITGRQALHAKLYRTKDENGFVIQHDFIPSESTLWRRIQALEKIGCLKIENVNNRCSLLTIVNYDTYQNVEQPVEQATDGRLNKRTLEREQPIDTSEEVKNLKTEELKKENPAEILASEELQRISERSIFPRGPTPECRKWFESFPAQGRTNLKNCGEPFEIAITEIQESKSCSREDAIEHFMEITRMYSDSWKGKSNFCGSAENFAISNWKTDPVHWQEKRTTKNGSLATGRQDPAKPIATTL